MWNGTFLTEVLIGKDLLKSLHGRGWMLLEVESSGCSLKSQDFSKLQIFPSMSLLLEFACRSHLGKMSFPSVFYS